MCDVSLQYAQDMDKNIVPERIMKDETTLPLIPSNIYETPIGQVVTFLDRPGNSQVVPCLLHLCIKSPSAYLLSQEPSQHPEALFNGVRITVGVVPIEPRACQLLVS